jgi:hypothetical protein
MQITERRTPKRQAGLRGQLRRVAARRRGRALNRFKRVDEKPFEAASASPSSTSAPTSCSGGRWCRHWPTSTAPSSAREFHPLRFQRWAFSDLNPFLWWLAPAAQAVKAQRRRWRPIIRRAARVGNVGGAERLARLPSGAARRNGRGDLLPDLRQPLRVLSGRRTRSRNGGAGGGPARASIRQEVRWPRSTRAATRRRWLASPS